MQVRSRWAGLQRDEAPYPLQHRVLGSWIIAEAFENLDIRLATEPRHLPLGVSPCFHAGMKDCLAHAQLSPNHLQRLFISNGFKGFGLRGEAPVEYRLRFLKDSICE